eukprot:m.279130 g.279130  ORF g.279130 m.279130 type:complete len:77 (-) comp139574_c0_seq1:1174-1404(-)
MTITISFYVKFMMLSPLSLLNSHSMTMEHSDGTLFERLISCFLLRWFFKTFVKLVLLLHVRADVIDFIVYDAFEER